MHGRTDVSACFSRLFRLTLLWLFPHLPRHVRRHTSIQLAVWSIRTDPETALLSVSPPDPMAIRWSPCHASLDGGATLGGGPTRTPPGRVPAGSLHRERRGEWGVRGAIPSGSGFDGLRRKRAAKRESRDWESVMSVRFHCGWVCRPGESYNLEKI